MQGGRYAKFRALSRTPVLGEFSLEGSGHHTKFISYDHHVLVLRIVARN